MKLFYKDRKFYLMNEKPNLAYLLNIISLKFLNIKVNKL